MRVALAAIVAVSLLGGAPVAFAQPAPQAPPGSPPPGMPPLAPPGAALPGVPAPPPGMPPALAPPGAALPGVPAPPGAPAPPSRSPAVQPYPAPPVAPYAYPFVNVLPPATLPYEEGAAVPAGYQVKTRAVRSMVVAGSITFGSTYVVSALVGSTMLAALSSEKNPSTSPGAYAPLFVPLAGPFITIGTTHASGAGALWLVLDGLTQTAGAVMLIYGLAAEEKYLQRTAGDVLTRPQVLVGPSSAALRWKF